MSTSFGYQALDLAKKSFRLLKISSKRESRAFGQDVLAGNPGANPIQSTLAEWSLSSPPPYIALSYTWGRADLVAHITINSLVVLVTESVYIMLQHLQREDEAVTVWLDLLCINQTDDAEKEWQILLMRDIYQRAEKVLCWLGPSADDSDAVMKFVGYFGKAACEAGAMDVDFAGWDNLEGQAKIAKQRLLAIVDEMGHDWPIETYRALATRAWWSRVWVMQELALATNAEFMCGRERVPYIHFQSFEYALATYGRALVAETEKIDFWKPLDREEEHLWARLQSVSPVKSPASRALLARRNYQKRKSEQGSSLFLVLTNMHLVDYENDRLLATDERDKVFGILGLVDDLTELEIRPNYTMSCAEVYTDVAGKIISRKYTDMLALNQFPKALGGLPSWVPDWSAAIRLPRNSHATFPLFLASDYMPACIEQSAGSGIIAIRGSKVDAIEYTGATVLQEVGVDRDFLRVNQVLEEVLGLCEAARQLGRTAYKDGKALEEAPWRIPIGDQEKPRSGFGNDQRATEWSHECYTAFRRFVPVLKRATDGPDREAAFEEIQRTGTPRECSEYFRAVLRYSGTPYITKCGYVGLGPRGMAEGDVVCVLFGGRIPYLLRPAEDERYSLIGEIYVHGIMDGEYVKGGHEAEMFTLV
jgi:hypothetical protein